MRKREGSKRTEKDEATSREQPVEELYRNPHFRSFERPRIRTTGSLLALFLIGLLAGGIGGFLLPSLLLLLAPDWPLIRDFVQITNLKPEVVREVRTTVAVREDENVAELATKVLRQAASLALEPEGTRIQDEFITSTDIVGSAFAVSTDGWLGTHLENVPPALRAPLASSKATTKLLVLLPSGSRLAVKRVVPDPFSDLAYLKVDATDLTPALLEGSHRFETGATLLVPDPFGQGLFRVHVLDPQRSLADPEGSSEHRAHAVTIAEELPTTLVGGGVWNLDGALAGVLTKDRGFVPVSYLREKLSLLLRDSTITRPSLGVRFFDLARRYSGEEGALIGTQEKNTPAITPKSPAYASGLRTGDVILKVNDDAVTSAHPLPDLLQDYKPGETVRLAIRRSGKERTIEVTLGRL